MEILYFDTSHAINTHDKIIEVSGGLSGIKDIGQLESILDHIQNDLYYPSFEDKIAHLVFTVSKFHIFNDGNKRTAIALGAYFLVTNGYDFCSNQFITQMENIVVWTVENKISKELLTTIISEIIEYEDLSENTKLSIISSIE